MAVDKLVDSSQLDADLTSVANAIRTKGGTSASLAFPAGFVSAIGAIPTGGGGGTIPLPAGWTQLDYADTTGSCAVDLGMKFSYPATGFAFFYKVGVLDATNIQILCSSGYDVGGYVDQTVIANNALVRQRTGASLTNKSYLVHVGDDLIIYSSNNSAESKGDEFSTNLTTCASKSYNVNANMMNIPAGSTQTMKLFAEYKNSNYTTFATVRFYELYYQEADTEIMHLYPVKDNNNVTCLYDTVSETAIYPATGQFVNNAPQLLSAGRILMGVEE